MGKETVSMQDLVDEIAQHDLWRDEAERQIAALKDRIAELEAKDTGLGNAFLAGAKWWAYHQDNATNAFRPAMVLYLSKQVAGRDRRIAALEEAMSPQDVADVDAALAGKEEQR